MFDCEIVNPMLKWIICLLHVPVKCEKQIKYEQNSNIQVFLNCAHVKKQRQWSQIYS